MVKSDYQRGAEVVDKLIAAKSDIAELVEALAYWLPKSMPFPDMRRDVICESHNLKWEIAHAVLAKYRTQGEGK